MGAELAEHDLPIPKPLLALVLFDDLLRSPRFVDSKFEEIPAIQRPEVRPVRRRHDALASTLDHPADPTPEPLRRRRPRARRPIHHRPAHRHHGRRALARQLHPGPGAALPAGGRRPGQGRRHLHSRRRGSPRPARDRAHPQCCHRPLPPQGRPPRQDRHARRRFLVALVLARTGPPRALQLGLACSRVARGQCPQSGLVVALAVLG